MSYPDDLERLWAPYRMAYVRTTGEADDTGCPFCSMAAGGAQSELVVARGDHAFVAMNLYPYNPGHLMVLPNRHTGDFTALSAEEQSEITALTRHALLALKQVSNPHGFNVGFNIGAVAGGSISQHLHQHIVPRWGGDANFMTVVAGTKTLPQVVEDTAAMLRDVWDEVT